MPLIRYDTDDMAEVADGHCKCGRTLPVFREIHGRYRRTTLLPPGVWDYWVTLRRGLNAMPIEELRNLRQYQLKHRRNGTFTLLIVSAGEMEPTFREKVKRLWDGVTDEEPPPLEIKIVEEISTPQGGKFQSFTSEYFPDYGETGSR
jgi:phenylacetate-CoA ligase